METRHIAVAAAVLVAGLAGCTSQPPALGGTTAKVTIDGKDTGNPHAVRCSQTGWAWTIETPDKAKGFTAVIAIRSSRMPWPAVAPMASMPHPTGWRW